MTTDPTDKERAEFEEHYRMMGFREKEFDRHPLTGAYLSDPFAYAFDGWLARSRVPMKVTDEMVEAALIPYCCPGERGCICPTKCAAPQESMKREVRAILTAALAPVKEG